PELQALYESILRQDPAIRGEARPPSEGIPPAAAAGPPSPPAERREPRSERKFATALFADLVGSTALAEREDPEVVRSVVGRAFERLVREIERYGGVTEKFVGDAVLAIFGVPTAHEDDPERAIRAALDMQASIAELNRELAAERGLELSVRIGIEAGEVLVELDRVTGSRERMLTGDAVNTAARLQAAADPGQIIVGPRARAVAEGAIGFRALGPLSLKGKADPVEAWEPVGARTRIGGERPPARVRAPLIGRDEELALLEQTFRRVASEGRPGLVTIFGPAGVGKSRLASELERSLAGRAHWRKGRCLAYGGASYSALADAIKAECEILEDDTADVVEAKAARTVERMLGPSDVGPAIEALVGSGSAHGLSREELFDAWRRFLERMAAAAPLVLQLEDLHWADEGLLDFVEHVADWAEGPLLVLTLARPELLQARPAWGGGKRNYAAVYLDPLSPEETRTMLEALLPAGLPDAVSRLIVERSEGYPLFTEEVVGMLIDRRLLVSDGRGGWTFEGSPEAIEVPPSVQALIAARIDALPTDEKAMLQDAAVVGRTFWLGAVRRLSDVDGDTAKRTLGRLRVKELLVAREAATFSGETEYQFRHVLIRDVAYESLPKGVRARKHVQVADWAKEQAGQRSDETAALLATHLCEALRYRDELGEREDLDLVGEAWRWSRAAGRRSLVLWEHRAAAHWFRLAADLGERAGRPAEERAADLESYARAAEAVESYGVVAEASERALDLYLELGRDADAGRVEAWLAHVAFQSGDEAGTVRWAERALARLEPLGDGRDLALALVYLGWYRHRTGHDDEAEPLLARAVAVAERVGDPVVSGEAMLALGMLTYKSGRTAEGMALLGSALEVARRGRDLPFLLRALLVVSEAEQLVEGDYERAASLVREGADLAKRAGHVGQIAWMQGNLADYLVDMGKLGEAEPCAREGLEAARVTGEVARTGYSLLMLAWILTLRDRLDEAEALLTEAGPVLAQMRETYHEGWAALIAGTIAGARGDAAAAQRILLEGAREATGRLEAWAGQPLLTECVRSLVRDGRPEEARRFRDELARIAEASIPTRTFVAWVDALIEADAGRAREALLRVADELSRLGRRLDHGRCLEDLAARERALGLDPRSTLLRAREVFESCGAALHVRRLDDATGQPL
ncbi:MAG TPA: AAA family ATPase, partial [Gaiellaceae bacterium]|nr:AAA family ATPase [Gaiellaceae bacterium]